MYSTSLPNSIEIGWAIQELFISKSGPESEPKSKPKSGPESEPKSEPESEAINKWKTAQT